MPWTGKQATIKQKSIIEAHEKGHKIRNYHDSTDKFQAGFDLNAAVFSDEFYNILKQAYLNESDTFEEDEFTLTKKEARENYFQYLFSGSEIAERMAQLKNYFGFSGDEQFTKKHLDYARKHYVADTNYDNGMTVFFSAITKETTDKFLYLINNYGM